MTDPYPDPYRRDAGCDDCSHELFEHDPKTGACNRINPTFGVCPCRHTTPEERKLREAIHQASRGQRTPSGKTNN